MDQKLITDYFPKKISLEKKKNPDKKVYGYNPDTESWHCMTCGIDMGKFNPRQLCRKWYCENEFI